MIFNVLYDENDENINLPFDVEDRINTLKVLKSKGYTHVSDKWMTILTGEKTTHIDQYIKITESYL